MQKINELGKHAIQCVSCMAYHTCIFNMVCVGACKCDHMLFLSRPVVPSFCWMVSALTVFSFFSNAQDSDAIIPIIDILLQVGFITLQFVFCKFSLKTTSINENMFEIENKTSMLTHMIFFNHALHLLIFLIPPPQNIKRF